MFNLDQFVSERSPTWTELEQLVARRGRTVRAGSAPTAFAGSVSAIAQRGRPRARAPPLSRRSRSCARLERLVQRGRQGVYNSPSVARRACGSSSRPATGDASASARSSSRSRSCASRCRRCSAATGRGAIPVPASGLVPSQYQSVTEPRTPGKSLGAHRRRRVGDGVADLHEQHRRDVLRVRGRARCSASARSTCCCRTACCSAWSPAWRSARATGASFFELVTAHGVLGAELHHRVGRGRSAARVGRSSTRVTAPRGEALRARGARRDRDRAGHHAVARRRRAGRGIPHAVRHRARRRCSRSGCQPRRDLLGPRAVARRPGDRRRGQLRVAPAT